MLSFFKNTYSIIQNSKLFFNTENIFLDTFALVLHLQKKYMAFVILFSRYIHTTQLIGNQFANQFHEFSYGKIFHFNPTANSADFFEREF